MRLITNLAFNHYRKGQVIDVPPNQAAELIRWNRAKEAPPEQPAGYLNRALATVLPAAQPQRRKR